MLQAIIWTDDNMLDCRDIAPVAQNVLINRTRPYLINDGKGYAWTKFYEM